ncbi:cytochrome-c peroxidase [Aliiglaciecola litoralis]|uniref:Di-heme enzyme n=1 Tax=Aliiglaciecola litoralis TaxID=582857 RepID=A0ABP3X4R0_9ALTE
MLCFAVVLAGMLGGWWLRLQTPSTTPVSFSAPFVFGRFIIPQDNPLTVESIALGRRLFYDPKLSGNNQVSCATCHKQHLAFTDGLPHSIGVSGNPLPFNSMSLANLLWGPQLLFWNGRASSLEEQALQPIEHVDEMAQDLSLLLEELASDAVYHKMFAEAYGNVSLDAIAKALANFQRTLVSANSKYDQYLRGELNLSELEEQGRRLFMAHPDTKVSLRGGNCIDCHSQFLTGGFNTAFDGFNNNGLDDDATLAAGLAEVTGLDAHKGMFKTPTLRNIAVTAPYMHDGRFNTLEEVLAHYNGGIKRSSTLSPLILEADNVAQHQEDKISLNLTKQEERAIIAFLHTLTDKEFLTDERFSNPFTAKKDAP